MAIVFYIHVIKSNVGTFLYTVKVFTRIVFAVRDDRIIFQTELGEELNLVGADDMGGAGHPA